MSDFDWSLIRSFLAVLEAGSVSGGARALGALQPTVSRHVADLEEQLGVALFERTGRGVVPTAAGLRVAEGAQRMLDGAGDIALAAASREQEVRGTVRVTTSDVAATYLLPQLLARLRREEPGVQVELVVQNVLTNLLRREADIAVRMVRPQQSSLVAKKVADLPIVLCAHRRYLKRRGVPSSLEALLEHDLIGMDKDTSWLRQFAARGLPMRTESFTLRTDDLVSHSRLVAAGAGIGFLTAYTVPQLPGVVTLFSDQRLPALECWLAVHRELHDTPRFRWVFDFLAEHVAAEIERAHALVEQRRVEG